MTQSSHFSFLNENVNFIGNNALKEINVLLLPKIDSQKYLLSFVTCICLSFIHTHTHTNQSIQIFRIYEFEPDTILYLL